MIRAIDKWLAGYLRSVLRRPKVRPSHVIFCLADHFEPRALECGIEAARAEVERWCAAYSEALRGIRDCDGATPRHTFFYPAEDYDAGCVGRVADFCRAGFGEVEIHLHHRNDTPDGLRGKLIQFRDELRREHGLLGSNEAGGAVYGFIHGNWALCNSRPDGDWCGVDGELAVLTGTGCYADFTFPSAPSPTQPRTVNSIYRAVDAPEGPRGHDRGARVRAGIGGQKSEVGGQRSEDLKPEGGRLRTEDGRRREEYVSRRGAECAERGEEESATNARDTRSWRVAHEEHELCDLSGLGERRKGQWAEGERQRDAGGLMLVQGPLALDWGNRKWGFLPGLENAALTVGNPPTVRRLRLWARQHIAVEGQPDWAFVKVHTHGMSATGLGLFQDGTMARIFRSMQETCGGGEGWRIHYASAREMFNIIRAAEDGRKGNPGDYRDYAVGPPPCLRRNPGGSSPLRGTSWSFPLAGDSVD